MPVKECCVVVSFFSPVAFTLPLQHLQTVINSMHCQGVPLVFTQAVFPGQVPVNVPSSIPNASYKTKSLLFHKERLWNLGASLVESEKIIFLDGDVIFHNTDWIEKCADSLNYFDVIQPFHTATWLDSAGRPDRHRPSIAAAIASNAAPKLSEYHPGFGWGMTRKAFDELGGFYDAAVTGNSDALFALSLRNNKHHNAVEDWYRLRQDPHVLSPTYQDYKKRAASLNLTVGFPSEVNLTHLYHGERSNRQYITREKLFPRRPNNDYDIVEGSNGLQEWRDVETANRSTESYFISKRDDG